MKGWVNTPAAGSIAIAQIERYYSDEYSYEHRGKVVVVLLSGRTVQTGMWRQEFEKALEAEA